MVSLSRPGGQPLRIVGIHRDFRPRHGPLEDVRGVGARSVLQRIDDDLRCLLSAELFDNLLDPLVLFGCRPRHDFIGFATRSKTRLGKRGGQEANLVVAAARIQPFHRIDRHRGGRIDLTCDVDRLDDLFDRFMVLRTRHGGQALRIVGVRGQFGLGYCRLENRHCVDGSDGFQRVNRHVRLGLLRHLIDQRFDLFVVLGRSPGHDLPRFHACSETSLGERGGQEANGISRARITHAFQRVDNDRRRRIRIAFDIDRCQDLLDGVVVFLSRPGGHSLRILGIDRDLRLRNCRQEDRGGAGGRDVLQRIDDDLGRGLLAELINKILNLLVVLGRRPGHDLVGFSAQGEIRLRERAGQEAKLV